MANRFPLIVDPSDGNKIKELPPGDNLDLSGSDLIVKYSCDLWCEEEYFAFWKFKYRPITHSEVYRNYYRNYYNKYK